MLPHDPHTIHILFFASAAITPPDFSSSSSLSLYKALVQPTPHNPHDPTPQLLDPAADISSTQHTKFLELLLAAVRLDGFLLLSQELKNYLHFF